MSNISKINANHLISIFFREQLEKSYRLCFNCERVLKVTLSQQNAWLFGNHLKNFKNKAFKVISLNTDLNSCHSLSFVRHLLTTLNISVLCYLLNVKVELPTFDNAKQFIPSYFTPYTVIVNDYYHLVKNSSKNFAEEIVDLNHINIETNFLAVSSVLGFILQIFLVFGEHFSNCWKLNEMLAWILLFLTSSVSYKSAYSGQIKVLQVSVEMFMLSSSFLYTK